MFGEKLERQDPLKSSMFMSRPLKNGPRMNLFKVVEKVLDKA